MQTFTSRFIFIPGDLLEPENPVQRLQPSLILFSEPLLRADLVVELSRQQDLYPPPRFAEWQMSQSEKWLPEL
jgi:hypothetical protein